MVEAYNGQSRFVKVNSRSSTLAGRAGEQLRKICATRAQLRNICAMRHPDWPLLLEYFTWHVPCLVINRGRVQRCGDSLQPAENKLNRTST
jgi:hypothetical protein